MEADRPSQEGREDVPSELSFLVSAPVADPTPVVTRSSEMTRPEPTSAMVTRSRAREGREISIAPEVPIEPEVETRPEPAIATCEKGLGATRSYPTDTASLFTYSDKPETLTIPTSQEVTESSPLTAVQSQTSQSHISKTWERSLKAKLCEKVKEGK